jgi:hypothetical protein
MLPTTLLGAINGIAPGVDDGHVRSNGAELLGYVPAIENTGKLDVREDDINAFAPLQALDGVFSCGACRTSQPPSHSCSAIRQRTAHSSSTTRTPRDVPLCITLFLRDTGVESAYKRAVRHLELVSA